MEFPCGFLTFSYLTDCRKNRAAFRQPCLVIIHMIDLVQAYETIKDILPVISPHFGIPEIGKDPVARYPAVL